MTKKLRGVGGLGKVHAHRSLRSRRRQWRTAADQSAQPRGDLARVRGEFERGGRGGLYEGAKPVRLRAKQTGFG